MQTLLRFIVVWDRIWVNSGEVGVQISETSWRVWESWGRRAGISRRFVVAEISEVSASILEVNWASGIEDSFCEIVGLVCTSESFPRFMPEIRRSGPGRDSKSELLKVSEKSSELRIWIRFLVGIYFELRFS